MLTEIAIKNAKPAERPFKLTDSGGLFLLVNPNGSRWWRLRYKLNGKERGISLGVYPDVTLKRAREKRDAAQELLRDGIDPSIKRREVKRAESISFELVAREWFASQVERLSGRTVAKARWMLETFILPDLGSTPIATVTAPDVLSMLRKIEARGNHETARRTKQRVGQILRYAVATGRAQRDVCVDLRGALTPVRYKNHAAIVEPQRVGELLRAIDGFAGQPTTHAALKLAPLVFVRPGELRAAEWSEFELEGEEPTWRIPASRMKMRKTHIVPLSRQAVEILRDIHWLTGEGVHVFPAIGKLGRPLSDNTLNAALRRLGYSSEEMTAHGFRTIASTLLNERGFPPDLIELQLAHQERNSVRAAYNKALRLIERRQMMQGWADYLDSLKATSVSQTAATATSHLKAVARVRIP